MYVYEAICPGDKHTAQATESTLSSGGPKVRSPPTHRRVCSSVVGASSRATGASWQKVRVSPIRAALVLRRTLSAPIRTVTVGNLHIYLSSRRRGLQWHDICRTPPSARRDYHS